MDASELDSLRYPVGQFAIPEETTDLQLAKWISQLEALPAALHHLVEGLSEAQLDTPYRPGGWTVRQLVHHIADSHHNSYVRFKWALTENSPTIRPYDEKAWAELFDSRSAPITLSLDHLRAVHAKLVYLLRGSSGEDLQRNFIHPEGNVASTVAVNIARYAWHSIHHYTHIKRLLMREGWLPENLESYP